MVGTTIIPDGLPEGSYEHLHWKASVHVSTQELYGVATYTIRSTPENGYLAFAIHALSNVSVHVNTSPAESNIVAISPTFDPLHSMLLVQVASDIATPYSVSIAYEISKNSLACHWFDNEWLITQSYPSYAPSLLPIPPQLCMKFKYTAEITTVSPVDVFMSASFVEKSTVQELTTTTFHQSVAVQAHALSLVISPRLTTSRVSKECIAHAASPLADSSPLHLIPALMEVAESTTGLSSIWSTWNIVVVPSTIQLSFASIMNPTLLVLTDESHDLATIADATARHWTAHRAPHETWKDVWLSEGWSKWLQLEILKMLELPLNQSKTWSELQYAMATDENTILHHEHHSSMRWSVVAREKGYLMLKELEALVGVEAFQFFVSAFISGFEIGSVTSSEFRAFCDEYFTHVEEIYDIPIEWTKWYHTPGYLPPLESISKWLEIDPNLPTVFSYLPKSWRFEIDGLLQSNDTRNLCDKFAEIQRQYGSNIALELWLQCREKKVFHPVTILRIEALIQQHMLDINEVDTMKSSVESTLTISNLDANKQEQFASTSTWFYAAVSLSVCVVSVAMGIRLLSVRS